MAERAQRQIEAADKVAALMMLPVDPDNLGGEGTFAPWSLFPLYGTYSSDFDECAIIVLLEISAGDKHRHDLGAEMFREMLCRLGLCEYGSSPRACFPTPAFKALLPEFIHKWSAYAAAQWGHPHA